MIPEVTAYVERFQDGRERMLKALEGMDEEGLNWRPVHDASNSLASLAIHTLGSERRWIHGRVAGKNVETDREGEFRARAEKLTTLQAMFVAVALESEQIFAKLEPADMDALRSSQHGAQTVRWCILHVLEHYNEHFGQMLLTRQLWENRAVRPQEI